MRSEGPSGVFIDLLMGAEALSHRLGYPLQIVLVSADYWQDDDLGQIIGMDLPDPGRQLFHHLFFRLNDEEILCLLVDLSLPDEGGPNLLYVHAGFQPLLDDELCDPSGVVWGRRAEDDHVT